MKKLFLFFAIGLAVFCLHAQRTITIETKTNLDRSVDFSYVNNGIGSYTVQIFFENLANATRLGSDIHILKGPAGFLFTLRPNNKEMGISYSYRYSYISGVFDPKKVDSSFVYVLPFRNGVTTQVFEQYNVMEVYLNKSSPKGWRSYQMNTKDTDSIFSIRKGTVVGIENNFEIDTISYYTSKQNQIVIEQLDGTIAVYKGFKKGGIQVYLGQQLLPHSFLGLLAAPDRFGNRKVSLMVYYISSIGFQNQTPAEHTFIAPLFETQSGIGKLINKQKYTASFTQESIMKELTKKEKKIFAKQ